MCTNIISAQEIYNKVLQIRDTTPFFQPFNQEIINTLQQYFLWKNPEKFFFNDEESKIISGLVRVAQGKRTIQLTFENGFVWIPELV